MDLLKPTVDFGVRPVVMDKPEPAVRTGKDIALEPEPYGKSKQVCELAAPCITEGVLVEFEGMEAHNPTMWILITWPLEIIWRICWRYLRRQYLFNLQFPLLPPSSEFPVSPEFPGYISEACHHCST